MNYKCLNIRCGPDFDQRTLLVAVHPVKRKIGVFVSGGLDSALLYFLLKNHIPTNYSLTPYIINRQDNSLAYAKNVINYINITCNKPANDEHIIDIPKMDPHLEVIEGLKKAKSLTETNHLFLGLIETLPEHSIGYPIYNPKDTESISYPFKHLNKSHIVDLIYKLQLEELFTITHSCVYPEGRCGVCNRCVERKWAFDVLKKTDPGTI